ncbi:hypothetical protein F5148DRAFT_1154793 [Russula earlei]|uniref:Uncharacterized protein n=1 Tax=Russula earlei TaxID=71964 RepID=A0ACC0TR62_9AGAM|nr:hypothetical protein F5148DRAFT_1154793 [Russula earlei]
MAIGCSCGLALGSLAGQRVSRCMGGREKPSGMGYLAVGLAGRRERRRESERKVHMGYEHECMRLCAIWDLCVGIGPACMEGGSSEKGRRGAEGGTQKGHARNPFSLQEKGGQRCR